MPFLTELSITPISPINWRLNQDLVYLAKSGAKITIKAGYVTDGESGKALLKDLLIKPNNYRQVTAFIHDALYQAGMLKEWCDRLYYEMLLSLPIDPEDSKRLYEAVNLFGSESYDLDQKDIEKAHTALDHLHIELP